MKNLIRVPLKFRCPQCWKIMVKPSDRKYWDASFDLGFYGGVCQKCWLNGHGKYGNVGRIFAHNIGPLKKALEGGKP